MSDKPTGSFLSDSIESVHELNCEICLELFDGELRNPRSLFCGHSFCEACLERIILRNPRCPTCKSCINYKHVEEIPINYSIKSLVERLKNKNSQFPFSNPDSGIIGNTNKKNGECQIHSEQLCCMQCLSCNEWICSECSQNNHNTCEKLPIRTFLKQKQNVYIDMIDKANEANRIEKSDLKLLLQLLDFIRSSLLKEIDEKMINKEKVEHCITVSRAMKSKKKQINSELNKFRVQLLDASNGENYIDQSTLESTIQPYLSLLKSNTAPAGVNGIYVYLKTIKGTKSWFEGKPSQEDLRYGRISVENGKFKISTFQSEKPKAISDNVLVNFREFLLLSTGSHALPTKSFLEIWNQNEALGQVIITAEGRVNPRSLNFLLLVSGLRKMSYKGTKLSTSFECAVQGGDYLPNGSVIPAVVEGIENGGIYKAKLKRGFVFGLNLEAKRDSVFIICHSDFPGKGYGNKFAKVEQGMNVIDKAFEILDKNPHTNIHIKECGFLM